MSTSCGRASSFYGSVSVDAFCFVDSVKYCDQYTPGSPAPNLYLDIAAPFSAIGDGIFTFTAWGDFNKDIEYLDVAIEDYSLGSFLNDDPSDDLFADDGFADGLLADIGNEYGGPNVRRTFSGAWSACRVVSDTCLRQPPRTGTAIIPQADLASILLDGIMTVSVWFSPGVSDGPCCEHTMIEEFVIAGISFETATVTAIPAPPALVLFVSSLIGLAGLRRRHS